MSVPNKPCGKKSGFSLIEVAIALGVFAFTIVGVIGMIAVGSQSARNSVAEMGAVNLARTLQSDFRLASTQSPTSTPLTTTPIFSLPNPALGTPVTTEPAAVTKFISDNNQVVTSAGQARYRLTIQQLPLMQYTNTTPPATVTSLEPSRWLLTISWPPGKTGSPDGSVETVVSVPQ